MSKFKLSGQEKFDLIVSWITISIAFAILLGRGFLNIASFAVALPISMIIVGTGFILHELAHKYTAIHYGAWAEYRLWNIGLVIALLSSFFGFIFAAPGAVYIFGDVSRKKNGIISVAGPLTNVAVAVIFLFIHATTSTGSIVSQISAAGYQFNFFLALFNMIPFGPLDGSKVMAWDPKIWALVFIPLLFLNFFL